jgi:hypothetical protein
MKRLFSSLASFQLKKPETPARPIAQGDQRLAVAFHLQGAAITDQHLAPLAGLQKVVSLNLAKTAITDAALPAIARHAGLSDLAPLPKLRSFYVWQTKATPAGAKKLKEALPKLEINLGWDDPPAEKP